LPLCLSNDKVSRALAIAISSKSDYEVQGKC
jgi:hypothetical protein